MTYTVKDETILIVSGEGERGTAEIYTGKRTRRALKMRLTKERCHGDRWARAEFDDDSILWGLPIDVDMMPSEW